jgi:hypothetical protein
MASKFGNSAEVDEPVGPRYDYYGMSQAEWYALTPEQRVTHYNRVKACDHVCDMASWPPDLVLGYSYDPAAHTPHMIPHLPFNADCVCQMCDLKIGIERENL